MVFLTKRFNVTAGRSHLLVEKVRLQAWGRKGNILTVTVTVVLVGITALKFADWVPPKLKLKQGDC